MTMQTHINLAQIFSMDQKKRALFINSLSGFKSANLVGTCDQHGITNLAIISSLFHLGADPALVGMIIRPDSVPRDTLTNIKQQGVYTINHVNVDIWQQAHQTSARYLPEQSEFEQVGLTSEYLAEVNAPFVEQSLLKFAVNLAEIVPLNINNTILVIGAITDVLLPEQSIQSDGYIDIESLGTVAVSSLDSYHATLRLARLSYAKVDLPLRELAVDGLTR